MKACLIWRANNDATKDCAFVMEYSCMHEILTHWHSRLKIRFKIELHFFLRNIKTTYISIQTVDKLSCLSSTHIGYINIKYGQIIIEHVRMLERKHHVVHSFYIKLFVIILAHFNWKELFCSFVFMQNTRHAHHANFTPSCCKNV